MATKTYRVAAGADTSFGALSELDQTAATRTDGWTVAKIAAADSAEFKQGTKQTSAAFTVQSSTPRPNSFVTGAGANAFKTPASLNGVFASAAWTFTFAVRATTASSQAGRIRLRVFKGANANGTGATELTGATQVGTTSAALSTTADVTSVVTWSPGATVTLNNEYLFFLVAWEITTASGNNSGDVQLRTGQSAAGSFLVTPNYTPTVLTAISTLVDAFTTAVDKVTKWPNSNAATAWDAGYGGRAILPCALTYSTLQTSQTSPGYDLTGSALFAKMTPPQTGTGTRELWMEVIAGTGSTEKLSMVVSAGNLIARRTNAGAQNGQNSVAYNPVAHAWWRTRESGGTIFFDVSPDGVNWTNFWSTPPGMTVTNVWVSFSCGYFGTETADNGYVDNVNTYNKSLVVAARREQINRLTRWYS